MPSILTIVLSVSAACFSFYVYRFVYNLIVARRTGFPSVYVPLDQNNVIWFVKGFPTLALSELKLTSKSLRQDGHLSASLAFATACSTKMAL